MQPGAIFGLLVVVSGPVRRGDRKLYWECLCKCGASRWVRQSHLISGRSQSCGCSRGAWLRENNTTHGFAARRGRRREYQAWAGAKSRCLNPKSRSFEHYGARGIEMCGRWLCSFEAFIADMGSCPDGHTLERKDTNGNYEPNNCCWVLPKEQLRNRRCSILINRAGEMITLHDYVQGDKRLYNSLHRLIKKCGMSPAAAIAKIDARQHAK